ncbi:MAG: SDR family oxidoreductase [Nanoarchaeota archaeon]
MANFSRIFVTGGAGYVGSALVPYLLAQGKDVSVYDTFWYGDTLKEHPRLRKVKGDIRNRDVLFDATKNHDALIHLACISNDPSFDLDPNLGKSINRDAFFNVLDAARQNSEARFIYASSSSIYGVKSEPNVVETTPADPLTDYSKYKLECENILVETAPDLEYVTIRPATVCGYAPRLRLDLVVNILTAHALERRVIRVEGGDQLRPNIAMDDMVSIYNLVLHAPREKIYHQTFNAGYENYTVKELAEKVQKNVLNTRIEYVPIKDPRSYHINSNKIRDQLGFKPCSSIDVAIQSLVTAYQNGLIQNALTNPLYHNIRRMKELALQ